jgi:hypothetical protein
MCVYVCVYTLGSQMRTSRYYRGHGEVGYAAGNQRGRSQRCTHPTPPSPHAHLYAPHHQQCPPKLQVRLSGVAQHCGCHRAGGVRPGPYWPWGAAVSPRRARAHPSSSWARTAHLSQARQRCRMSALVPAAPLCEKPDLRHNFLLLVGSETFGRTFGGIAMGAYRSPATTSAGASTTSRSPTHPSSSSCRYA